MEKNKRHLVVLAILMGIIWVLLLITQIRLTERVFYSYKQVFQNKLDIAVNELLYKLDNRVFSSYFERREDPDWPALVRNHLQEYDDFVDGIPVDDSLVKTIKDGIFPFWIYVQETQSDISTRELEGNVMDSLISVVLHDHFIYEPCGIGLYRHDQKAFSYVSGGVSKDQLLDKGFKYDLLCFDSDGSFGFDELYLFFPDLDNHFRWDIFVAYVTIILLLLSLLYCFIVFIIIIIRQRKLNEYRNNMLNNITHELKTPITTISLAMQMLQDQSVQKDENSTHEYLNMISEESDSLLNMIDEVLTIFRSEKMPSKILKEVEIHALIKQAINNYQLQLDQCNAKVDFDFRAERDVVMGNSGHLLNGISNLIDNAIKYRNGDLVITISTVNVGNTIEIRFKDNGIGIDKSDQQLVFEPFARVNTSNEHYVKGYGLGLNYLSQIVNYHRGTIKVESELGKGATFIVSLPLKMK